MKPLPGGCYTACDYKAVLKVPNNYHIEYDGHYYSVLYSYCGKPAILKATASEIRICDQYNRLICTHKRSYREFPLYITVDEHMPPEHLYYKEVNSKDGNYYRRWASTIGPAMSELIDRLLKSSKHEEQSYNACAGILHKVKTIPKGAAEEVARKCIEINSCKYFTFKQMLKKMDVKELPEHSPGTLPNHENIRGNRTVKYIRANTLLKESDHARQEGTYFEYSNEMAAYDLMVIDDFGLMDLDIEKCRDLFEIIESRDCRKATIIISQIPVSGWYQLFGDSTYADACLSRMTSKAYRLEFPGRDRRITNSN